MIDEFLGVNLRYKFLTFDILNKVQIQWMSNVQRSIFNLYPLPPNLVDEYVCLTLVLCVAIFNCANTNLMLAFFKTDLFDTTGYSSWAFASLSFKLLP